MVIGVLYAGTFSKVLFPALRLGYLVVPPALVSPFVRAASLLTFGHSVLEQAVVASFMQKGHFARHIRRMRMLYAKRRQALVAALQETFAGRVRLEMQAGGMHLLARFAGEVSDVAMVRQAMACGLAPTPLSSMAVTHSHGDALLLSFTNIPTEAAPAVVRRLRDAIAPRCSPGTGLTVAPRACDAGSRRDDETG